MSAAALSNASAVITTCEVNERHGTGMLVKRIVADTPEILSIRSMSLFGGAHDFGDVSVCLVHDGLSRQEAVQNTVSSVGQHAIRRILCIPYVPNDLTTAIALHDAYGSPLATHIMDDQNIGVPNIPDPLMGEFLSKCSLRLVTHPELREAYETKYRLEFWLLPAVVADRLISTTPAAPTRPPRPPWVGALIGSISSEEALEDLRAVLRDAGCRLDWYNGSVDGLGSSFYDKLQDDPNRIRELGITPCGLLHEAELAEELKAYSYAVIPVNDRDENPRLWRMIFALATANIPVVVMGRDTTSAARLARRFDVGLTCEYRGNSLREAVRGVTDGPTHTQMRRKAAGLAPAFSAKGINEWLWESIDRGAPCDARFEKLLPRDPDAAPGTRATVNTGAADGYLASADD